MSNNHNILLEFEDYLKSHLPNSDLNSHLFPIEGLYSLTFGDPKATNGIELFDKINNDSDDLYILITDFVERMSDFPLTQIKSNEQNKYQWFIEDSEDEQVRLTLFKKKKSEINFNSIFKALAAYDNNSDAIYSRIYFINPRIHLVFIYWDDAVQLQSNFLEDLKPFFNKYKPLMNEYAIQNFGKTIDERLNNIDNYKKVKNYD